VVVAVDQLAWEYLDRFDHLFFGGLRRLRDEAVVFEQANYDHAVTATAPGHSTIATGAHPTTSGMVGNSWFGRETRREVYSFADAEHGRSPANLRSRGLADWLAAVDPSAKRFTVSRKDRSAIALGGHAANAAFWYDGSTGRFTTSGYYSYRPGDWIESFYSQHHPDLQFGQFWETLPLSPEDHESLGILQRDQGWSSRRFPYALGGLSVEPGSGFYGTFGGTPFADEYVTAFATALIREEQLGRGERLDYLGIGLSALDSVGHTFGPTSLEVADTLLRLDDLLGRFLETLDREVGLDRVVLVFSSDHGVSLPPEIRQLRGESGRRAGDVDALCFQNAGRRVAAQLGLERMTLRSLYLDRTALAEAGIELAQAQELLARALEDCEIVERAWTATEIEATRMDEPEHFRRLYRHSFDPERSADVMLQLTEGSIAGTSSFATHGSPYEYDTHVPVLLRLPGIGGAHVVDPIRVVDLAPTLASLLGLPTGGGVDGKDLSDLLRSHLGPLPNLSAYEPSVPEDAR
jgi:predicted AlkP superfamily pyrophosphatase or phosphodiesterase